jgi:redox-sensitive bicupin YhaK (pirin superfamily)
LKKTLHPATARGYANHGWLKANHSFSFASWYDPEKVHFGCLRVWNDDWVAPGMGFGTHPHDNMEIVTIPLTGVLEHADSMGNREQLHPGEVQAMSAGTGITHSEYNGSKTDPCTLFQIWVLTAKRQAVPRYHQVVFPETHRANRWGLMVGPDGAEEAPLHVYQNAWFSQIQTSEEASFPYTVRGGAGQGVYFMVVEGQATVAGTVLGQRDGVGVWEVGDPSTVDVDLAPSTRVVAVEVPMALPVMH